MATVTSFVFSVGVRVWRFVATIFFLYQTYILYSVTSEMRLQNDAGFRLAHPLLLSPLLAVMEASCHVSCPVWSPHGEEMRRPSSPQPARNWIPSIAMEWSWKWNLFSWDPKWLNHWPTLIAAFVWVCQPQHPAKLCPDSRATWNWDHKYLLF